MPPTTCTLTIETLPGAHWGGGSRVVLAVLSSAWGCVNSVYAGTSPTEQRPAIGDLAVMVLPNRASPLLARACFLGQALPRAPLAWHDSEAPDEPVLAFLATDVFVGAYSHSGAADEAYAPTDAITLSPRMIELVCRLDPTATDPFAATATPVRSGAMDQTTGKIG